MPGYKVSTLYSGTKSHLGLWSTKCEHSLRLSLHARVLYFLLVIAANLKRKEKKRKEWSAATTAMKKMKKLSLEMIVAD